MDRVTAKPKSREATTHAAATESCASPQTCARRRAFAARMSACWRLRSSRVLRDAEALRMKIMEVPIDRVKALLRLFWATSCMTCSLVLRHWARDALKAFQSAVSAALAQGTPSTRASPAATRDRPFSRLAFSRSRALELASSGTRMVRSADWAASKPSLTMPSPVTQGRVVFTTSDKAPPVSRMLP